MSGSSSVKEIDFPGSDMDRMITLCEPLDDNKDFWYYLPADPTFNSRSHKKSVVADVGLVDFKSWVLRYFEPNCHFCSTISQIKVESRVHLFLEINRAAKYHMLAVPKDHKPTSVVDLRQEHIPLLREMKQACDDYFRERSVSTKYSVYGFHIPPFTSVNHLYLHCLIRPFDEKVMFQYFSETYPFISYDEVLDKLSKGEQIQEAGFLGGIKKTLFKSGGLIERERETEKKAAAESPGLMPI